jgi:hypothetical protein
MILSAAQPYFAPYPGFFEKMLQSDVFVLLDTVQFPRGGTWMTRNRFKNDGGLFWIRVPIRRKGRGLQRIDRVRIHRQDRRWVKKLLASLENAYRHAPFFSNHFGIFKDLFESDTERLAVLNAALIEYVVRQLKIRCRILRLSDIAVEGRGSSLLSALCRRCGADTFLAQGAAEKYLDPSPFVSAGIRLRFFRPSSCIYPQLWGRFAENLSVFDLLFCCGPRARAVIEGGPGRPT